MKKLPCGGGGGGIGRTGPGFLDFVLLDGGRFGGGRVDDLDLDLVVAVDDRWSLGVEIVWEFVWRRRSLRVLVVFGFETMFRVLEQGMTGCFVGGLRLHLLRHLNVFFE